MDYTAYCSAARGKKPSDGRNINKQFAASGPKVHIPKQAPRSPENRPIKSSTSLAPQSGPLSPKCSPREEKEEIEEANLENPFISGISKNVNPSPFIVHSNKEDTQSQDGSKSPEKSPDLGLDSPSEPENEDVSKPRSAKVTFAKETKDFLKAESTSWLPEVPQKNTATEDARAVTKEITNPRVLAALDRHKGITSDESENESEKKQSHSRLRVLALYIRLRALFEHREKKFRKNALVSEEACSEEAEDLETDVELSASRSNLAWKQFVERFHRHISGSKSKLLAWLQQFQPDIKTSHDSNKSELSEKTVEHMLLLRKNFDYVPDYYPFVFPEIAASNSDQKVHRRISKRCSQLLQSMASEYFPVECNQNAPPYSQNPSSKTDSICEHFDVTSLMEDLQGLNAFYITDEAEEFFNDWNNVELSRKEKAFLASLGPSRRASRYNPCVVEGILPISLLQASNTGISRSESGAQVALIESPEYNTIGDTQSIQSYDDKVDTSSVILENSDDEKQEPGHDRSLYYMSSNDDNSFNEWRRPVPYRTNFRPLSLVKSVASFSMLFEWDEGSNSTEEEDQDRQIVELDPMEGVEETPAVSLAHVATRPSQSLFKRVKLTTNRLWRSKEIG